MNGNRTRLKRQRGICMSYLLVWSLLLFISGHNADADSSTQQQDLAEQALNKQEALAHNMAIVSYGTVSTPIGYFLLVRKDKEECAIKFTSFHRGDYKKRTWWNAGGYSYFAEYDWYYQKDGSGDFTKLNVISGHKKLDQSTQFGPTFHLSGTTGTTFIKCGSMRGLLWTYPNNVAFNPAFRSESNTGIEMAPTRWQKPVQIDYRETGLKWYQFDHSNKRKVIYIPLSELCCN